MTLHIEHEINAQPEVISRLLSEGAEAMQHIAAAIRAFDPAFVCIAARGTSDNAGRYAQYLLGTEAGLVVALAAPSLHTLYHTPPQLGRALVIGISQSGQAADVRQVLDDARQQGALTLSITNDPLSPMAHAAAHHFPLLAGEEVSIAATKTYTAQLTAVAMLVAALTNKSDLLNGLAALPQQMQLTLEKSAALPPRVERYRYMEHFAVIGRGYNYCTAYEMSLKIKELCYVIGEEYSEADFRHGPIAVIKPGFPVMLIAPKGKTQPLMLDLIGKLRERQAETLVVSNDPALAAEADTWMPIAPDVPEWLSPIVGIVPGQLFAMHLALVKGYPVDKPRGLSKVTITE